jgi:protocatechuate 3,4-dioxygenase alpha subunit
MNDSSRIPSGSQTVGPYFRIGLESLLDRTPALAPGSAGTIEIRGQVLDRDGVPVPDAMLEFWSAASVESGSSVDGAGSGFPAGFRRAATGEDGRFVAVMERPAAARFDDEHTQAPHMLVLVFARGLMRHLLSRVYLGDEKGNDTDPVLMRIAEERRNTLIARRDESRAGLYVWNVVLQGTDETVFFAW